MSRGLSLGYCLAAGLLYAQGQPPPVQLRGHVLDETNAPLAGAAVGIQLDSREVRAYADPAGAFSIEVPAPGEYSVRVALPGYFDLRGRKVLVQAGSNEITLVLNRVRDRLESLDVTGVSSVIDMDSTAPQQRLTNAELIDIPYKSNNDLRNSMRVMPGVVQDASGGIHVNGAAEQQVQYTLDGFNITDPLTGTFQTRLSVESVQSMTVLSGAIPAEYGKGAAGVLAVNTKTGDDTWRYSATNFLPGIEYRKGLILGSFMPRLNLSGPIRKGKIWFSDSLTAQYNQSVVNGLPSGEDRNSSWRGSNMLRVQANLTPSNILYAGLLVNVWDASRDGLSALDPPQTTLDWRSRQWFYDVKDQIYLGGGSLVEMGFSSNRTFARDIPQGHDPYIYTPFGRRGNYFEDGIRESTREQWVTNYFLPSFNLAGAHQVKVGVDLDHVGYWQDVRRTGFLDYRLDSTLARSVMFAGSGLLARSNFESSGYVQDSWRVRPGLLLELGARADRDTILRTWNIAPRAGFTWAPRGLAHTKISGGYGILYDATNLVLFTRPADQYPIITLYPDGGYPVSSVSSYLVDRRNLQAPRYQNANLAVEQQLPSGLYGKVQALMRRGTHGLSYFDTTGLAAETVYRLQDGRRDNFDSVEVTLRQNFHKQYQWLLSYTRSLARSNSVIDLTASEPLIVPDNSGPLPWDAPNRLMSWGYLPTPWKNWSFAYLGEWRSGFPFSVRNEQGLVLGDVNSYRFPNYFDLDLSVEWRLELAGQRWAWRAGVNNVTNHQNFDVVNNDIDSPQFLRFFGGSGRGVSMRVRWLGKQ